MRKPLSKAFLLRVSLKFNAETETTICETCKSIIHIDNLYYPFRLEGNEVAIDCHKCYLEEQEWLRTQQ